MGVLVYAQPRAQRQAKTLLPGVVLEQEVARQIVAGNVCAGKRGYLIRDEPQRRQEEENDGTTQLTER